MGGGGGAIRVEEVVLSAMLMLSSIINGRETDALLLVLSSEGTGVLCDDRLANGGGGGFFDCEGGRSVTSGLGVGSRDCSLDALARASFIAPPLGPGTGGNGLFISADVRDFDLSSTGLLGSCSWPVFVKSSKATICGPETDLPCL